MLSRSVSFMSQLVRNPVSFISQICRVPKWLRLNCEGSATSSRRVRDIRDDFATSLRGILSHKIFEHVQNFRDVFAPPGDTWRYMRANYESLATVSRLLCDPLAMFVASCRKTVAVQWDRGLRTQAFFMWTVKILIILGSCFGWSGDFQPFSRGWISAPFPIENRHLFSQYHVCFSQLRKVKKKKKKLLMRNNDQYQNVLKWYSWHNTI